MKTSKSLGKEEVVRTLKKVIVVLCPEVWANLPFSEEGHPDIDQIEDWKDLERREEAEEWLTEHDYE